MPTIIRTSVGHGSREDRAIAAGVRDAVPTPMAPTAPTSPAANATAPTTSALAASTRPRRGLAASVVRIRPRRYSAVMNIVATTATAISPTNVPIR